MHVWDDATPLDETLAALDTAVASGRASYVGISNYTGWQTAQAATWQRAVAGRAPLASTQMEYSLLNRAVEEEVLPAADALGLGVLPYSPLAKGVLTGKYRTGIPSDSRGAADHSRVEAYLGDRAGRVVDAVARAADGLGWTPMEVALVWVRDRPGVTAPIVGARTAPSCAAPWTPRTRRCPRSSCRRSTTCRTTDEPRPAPAARRGVEWEFASVTFSREFPRNVVTKLLVERAEHGGWELDRVRIGPDGVRRVVLRRKIIRAVRTA